ncbi:hypothetical protein HYS47_00780 [Candidatus Woesearchaeota archaeon]|nr:hypothetical protein [Candidatus Woesearchaeota archaeon]
MALYTISVHAGKIMKTIYSNILGSFVFDSSFTIKEKILFSTSEQFSQGSLLQKGKLLEIEKKLAKAHKQVMLLGIRDDIAGQDPADPTLSHQWTETGFAGVTSTLRPLLSSIHEANILATTHDIRESFHRDIFIVQAIQAIQEIDKAFNMLVKRLREWFGYASPEITAALSDNTVFARLLSEKTKKELLAECHVPQNNLGAVVPAGDLSNITSLAGEISHLSSVREQQESYLDTIMRSECPNVQAVAGTMIGAKLIATAGSLKSLSQFPASTVQLLGAEKALFRHLTQRTRPPKYGHLINHPLIARAPREERGRTARLLADKLAIAAKVDYFKGAFIGDQLLQQVNAKLSQPSRRKKSAIKNNQQKENMPYQHNDHHQPHQHHHDQQHRDVQHRPYRPLTKQYTDRNPRHKRTK